MEITPLLNLDLCSPLIYAKTTNLPSEIHENEEFLLIYELNPLQSRSIEPEKASLLGQLLFIGRKYTSGELLAHDTNAEKAVLPSGNYLFLQCRANAALGREEWLDMVIEQQKDGLWERKKLESKLYVRFLFEDGQFVTQVYRPVLF
jgi:hypothetical protein